MAIDPSLADAAAASCRDTIFSLVATYLSRQSQDIAQEWANVPRGADGHRTFQFGGQTFYVARRATNDIFLMPGVNLYFGDDVVDRSKAKPRKWTLPVIFHVLVEWGHQPTAAEKLALRLAEQVMKSLEGLGGRVQVFDFQSGTPVPVTGRFLSWAHAPAPSWVWREASQPNKDVFTNRMSTVEIRYAR